jgi:iron complex transport system substrate-binding protein
MKVRIYFIIFLFSLALLSCSHQQKQTETATQSNSNKYAEGFSIVSHEKFKEVIVFSPWIKGSVYARYYLVTDISTETPENGRKVKIPLETLAATSVTHFEFLSLLGEIESINAVCSPEIIYNPEITKRLKDGKISNLGDAFNINIEKTLQLQPGAVMMSGYNQNDPYAQRVSQSGIPVLFNNEWMETSLLARAEWIKFVAAFYNKETLADSIFDDIALRYNEVKNLAKSVAKKPAIMAGSNFRGTWYMPAGRNFMAQLFADAGGSYFYANDTTSGSLPLNVESVLRDFANTDVWLNCNFSSIDDLIKSDAKHKLFKPVTSGQVYNFNKKLLPSTANDFWESAIARPDLLLSDVISILHPELLPGYETVYANKLK